MLRELKSFRLWKRPDVHHPSVPRDLASGLKSREGTYMFIMSLRRPCVGDRGGGVIAGPGAGRCGGPSSRRRRERRG
jgi:hypothetical protein